VSKHAPHSKTPPPAAEAVRPANLGEQFDDLSQQREAASLGMWVFLATEILFFGALFTGFANYRATYPEGFHEAGRHVYVSIGVINTAVLLTSSLFVALAVHAVKFGRGRATAAYLLVAVLLGTVFLALKFLEYYLDIREGLLPWGRFPSAEFQHPRHAQLFFVFYWFMTGLHALHMVIGISVLSVIAMLARRGRYTAEYYDPVEVAGLYWHFVDIVWIFILPTLYLVAPA
jgi:cytochrome c oxidase subunit III